MTIAMQQFERPMSSYRVKMKADGNKLGSGTLHITRSILPRSEADTNTRVIFERKGKIEFMITAHQLGLMRTEKKHDMKFDWIERGADGSERTYTAEVSVQGADGKRPEASQLHRDLFMAKYVFVNNRAANIGWGYHKVPHREDKILANIWFKDGKLSVPWMDGLKTRYADIVGKEYEGTGAAKDDRYYLYLLDRIEDKVHDSGIKGETSSYYPWSDNLVNWDLVDGLCPGHENDLPQSVVSQAILEILRSNVVIGIGGRKPEEIESRKVALNMISDDWQDMSGGGNYKPGFRANLREGSRFRDHIRGWFPAFDWNGLRIHGRTVADLEHYEILRMWDARIIDGDYTHYNGLYDTPWVKHSIKYELLRKQNEKDTLVIWWAQFLDHYNNLEEKYPGKGVSHDTMCCYVPSQDLYPVEYYHQTKVPKGETWRQAKDRIESHKIGARRIAEIIEREADTFTYRRQIHDRSIEIGKFFKQNRGAYRQKDGTILMEVLDGLNPPSHLQSAVGGALEDIRLYREGIEQDLPY